MPRGKQTIKVELTSSENREPNKAASSKDALGSSVATRLRHKTTREYKLDPRYLSRAAASSKRGGSPRQTASLDPLRKSRRRQAKLKRKRAGVSPISPPLRLTPRPVPLRGTVALLRKPVVARDGGAGGSTSSDTETSSQGWYRKQWPDVWHASAAEGGGEWHLQVLTWTDGQIYETWKYWQPEA